MRARPRSNGHRAVAQVLIDCGQAPVLRLAEGTDARNDIATTLMLGQGHSAFCFEVIGPAERRTGPIETAPVLQGKMHHVVQGRNRTIVMIGCPHRVTAERVMTPKRLEGGGCYGVRTRRCTCHGEAFPVGNSPLSQSRVPTV
jgi:hypothetical protein